MGSCTRGGILAVAVAIAGMMGMGSLSAQGAVVFSDTFAAGGSNLNLPTPGTPSATATSYEVAATKATTSSINPGDLQVKLTGATTSGIWEAQALFASSPVSLVNAGDSVELTMVFTGTNVLAGGPNSYLMLGLYNSHSSAPASGLQSSGLNGTAGSTNATGNAANWEGYVARFAGSTGTNQASTRPLQNGAGTSSANQEVLGNNVGGGTYANPAGSNFGATTSSLAALTSGTVYTNDLLLTLNADGTLQVTNSLYSGNGINAANLLASTSGSDGSTTPILSFDALAFGLRNNGISLSPQLDVNSLTVTTGGAAVPEPASLSLLALGGLGLLARRRRI